MNRLIWSALVLLGALFHTPAVRAEGPGARAEDTLVASPREHHYRLVLENRTVNFAGKDVEAFTVNGGIPGTTIELTEGEIAVIDVENRLKVDSSIHWHGILLPNREDGVSYLTTPPILPGTSRTFRFPVIQSGTYWYHSHTRLQEQQGVYGAIVIHPRHESHITQRDFAVVLSDWTDENPHHVLRQLKRGSHYPSLKKGTMQSVLGALQADSVGEYFQRELVRMPPMDISDVAYDAFLVNGKRELTLAANPGDSVRLRFINAAASSYFYLSLGAIPMKVVAADGIDIVPFEADRLLIAVAETYDVVLQMPASAQQLELRATAQDGSGFASVYIGSGELTCAPEIPQPNLYQMHGMHGAGMAMTHSMHQTSHGMSHEGMAMDSERPSVPYDRLRAQTPTLLPANAPVKTFQLELTGDMERYLWTMNNQTLSEADTIRIQRGQLVRFELKNKTMMHHPMHLHGHFFRVLNSQGDYSPLKHTVDVPPLGTRTIEFLADKEKDWFFHCHVLYHMKSGMSRIVSYEDSSIDADIAAMRSKLFMDPWFAWSTFNFLTQMSNGSLVLSNSRNTLMTNFEIGHEDGDYEFTPLYERYLDRFLQVFAGAEFESESNRGVVGFSYLLPLLVHSRSWVDSEGDFRFRLEKHEQLSERISLFGEVEYDTKRDWEGLSGLEYTVSSSASLVGQWHSDYGAGVGIQLRF